MPYVRGRLISRLRVVWLSALVLSAALVMQWMIFPPPQPTDSYQVFRAAGYWPDIPASAAPPWQMTRIGLLLPAWAAQRLLGPGQAAYNAASFLLVAVFAVGCYLAGRALFGDLAGLAATAVLLIHPFFTVVDYYTRSVTESGILPDAPGAGLFAAGVAALVVASRRAGGRSQTGWLLAAGTSFGLAFLCREFIVYMYAGIPVYFWLLRIRMRRIAAVAAAMLAVLAMDLVHNAIVFHDALAQLRADQAEVRTLQNPVPVVTVLGRFPNAMIHPDHLGVIFLVALGLNVIGLAVTRDRRLALTLVWFLSLWVPLTLLGGVFSARRPEFPWGYLARYWLPVLPAITIGGIGACILIVRLIPWRYARAAAAGALAAALTVAYVVPAAGEASRVRRDTAWSELRTWLSARGSVPVLWTDSYSAQTLGFYTRTPAGKRLWNGQIRAYTRGRGHGRLPPAGGRGPLLLTDFSTLPQAQLRAWHVLWRSSDGTLSILVNPPRK
jgi:4-amino-4-deoxy-L-arabinose transferase-like glycosyltransferase